MIKKLYFLIVMISVAFIGFNSFRFEEVDEQILYDETDKLFDRALTCCKYVSDFGTEIDLNVEFVQLNYDPTRFSTMPRLEKLFTQYANSGINRFLNLLILPVTFTFSVVKLVYNVVACLSGTNERVVYTWDTSYGGGGGGGRGGR